MIYIAAVSVAVRLITIAANAQQSPAPIAFTHLTVVDVIAGTIVPDMTVLVDGNRIGQIGKTRTVSLPSGARVVDAVGKFLIPGLWDMHGHNLAGRRDGWWVRSMLVVNGVTGVREMGAMTSASSPPRGTRRRPTAPCSRPRASRLRRR